jgi:RecB family exonuclease
MPRVVRLVQVADLDAGQRVLAALCRSDHPRRSAACVMLVPSRNAAEQFRRTLERRVLEERGVTPAALATALGLPAAPGSASVLVAPRMVTREGWYDLLHEASGDVRPRVSPIASEVLMAAAARAAGRADVPAPFLVRPGLVAEMVAFRDALRRLGHDLPAAAAHLLPDLEAEAAADKGAARLLLQTRFLLTAFADYEARLEASGALDEDAVRHVVRRAVGSAATAWPLTHLVVAVGDHRADAGGLWPADLDLIDALPLIRLDVVCTRREAQAGLARRLTARWPDAVQVQVDAQRARSTTLETPEGGARWFTYRDREEEVLAFARRIKAAPTDHVAATGLVYRRPLPYLYLAQDVLESSGIPYETGETLPLAAEPWAAALDVLVDSILADHTRATLVALLRHPHFRFVDDQGLDLPLSSISAFDRLLARDRYLGTPERLADLVQAWRVGRTVGQRRDLDGALRVAGVVLPLLDRLAPLRREAPPADHLDLIAGTVDQLARPVDGHDAAASRGRRVRAAVRQVLDTLRDALRLHDPHPVRAREVCAVLRRWIEARTFAPRRDGEGVQVLDATAARFGAFDRLRLVGLVDGEWPEASARNIFYPGFLLARLGWPDERERAAATRAAFADLLELPAVAVGVSVPELEQDAVVRPSSLLDELAIYGPSRQMPVPADEAARPVVPEAAMLAATVPMGALARLPETRDWLAWRMRRASAVPAGQTEPLPPGRYSVTAVERYLQCPFQYFSASVLRLTEEPEDEAGLPSRDAGVFVHDVLHACFAAWQADGHCAITPDDLPAARTRFQEVAERALERLPAADRPLERLRLFGSAVASGLIEKVLRVEVESFGDVASRELEVDVDGRVTVPDGDGTREVAIRGRVDRVDRTMDGGVRVIDYKSGRRPQQEGLQPAIYALAITAREAAEGRPSSVAPSGYVALREVAPWVVTVRDASAAADDAREFGEAVAGIEAGQFPVRPASIFRCRYCDFGSVCRKDYVGDD